MNGNWGGSYSCGKCGSAVPKDAGRCPHCGARLSGIRCGSCGHVGGSSDFVGDMCPRCGSAVRTSATDFPDWLGHSVLIGILVIGVGGYGLHQWHKHASTGTIEGTISGEVPAEDRTQVVLFVETVAPGAQSDNGPRPIRSEADFPFADTLRLENDVIRMTECTGVPCQYEADDVTPGTVSVCAAFAREGGTVQFIHTGGVVGCAPLATVQPGETATVDFQLDYVIGSGPIQQSPQR